MHIQNAAGEDSIIKTNYITVFVNPAPAFSAAPVSGCAPLNVQFIDESKTAQGSITGWIWDFGDGVISTQQKPIHTYTISDTFNVSLTVTNNFGCKKTLQQPSFIKVAGLVNAGFTYTYDDICKPGATFTFNNTSQSNSALTYQWLFGDGASSTEKNPVHVYATSGNFTIKLTAINAAGCSNTYEQQISVGNAKADFNYLGSCIDKSVSFTDNSSPKPLSETWNFGDGQTATGAAVIHIYKNSGSYQVQLNANFGNCADTIKKIVQTGSAVQANFTASGKLNTCNYPQTIQFTNTTQGAANFEWLFGDGTSSSEKNPAHNYTNAGKFAVTLIAYNINGCADTVIKNDFIELGPPHINGIENLPFEGCAPQTLTLKPLVSSGAAIASYKWDLGDGTTSSDATPKHTYQNTGVYTIKLIVVTTEGCSDTLLMPNAVALGKAPKAAFSASPLNTCAETPVQFTDASTGLITDRLWLFGDGGASSEQNPTHVYTDTGYQNVSLIVSEYGCYDTVTLHNYVYLKPPVANFNFSANCSSPFNYSFTDNSIEPKTWLWNFGDGGTSTQQNVTHVYTSKGTFYVSLTVTNGNCSYTATDTLNVISEHPSFSYKPLSTNFCKYDSIHFFVTQFDSANIRSYQWNFGDGTITPFDLSNSQVYHVYNNAGSYLPLLIIDDANNCIDTINKNVQVKIYGPHAGFSNQPGACVSSSINFKDASSSDGIHSITKWIWNYGDNTKADTLNKAPFMHTYFKSGAYNVSLKIIDDNGCYDTASNVDAINITNPVAFFSATDTLTCSKNAVQYIDSSNGISLSYKWNFGDGQTSTNPQPQHFYTKQGMYNVQLFLKDEYGCTDSLTKQQYIHVADPVAGFLLPDSLFLCPPAKIDPVNTSSNYSTLTWDFGDGNVSTEITPEHYYTAANTYTLKLIAQGYGNCYDTFTKPLVLKGPYAVLSYSPFTGCNPLNVSFSAKAKNTVQYIWDFGDGVTQTSVDSITNYTYHKPGKFLPQLVIVDSGGCRVPVVNNDTLLILGADANFIAALQPGVCDSALYNFTDSSMGLFDKVELYTWKFGDGDSSNDVSPSHYYHAPGLYTASLSMITEKGCIDNNTLPVNVLINNTPKVLANIPDSACVNTPVSLSANANNAGANLTWQWNIANGINLNSSDTTYTFSTAGNYNVFVSCKNCRRLCRYG